MKGKYEGQIRPKTGAPGIFLMQLEEDLALFMKHCDLLRIPKSRQDLKCDIRHYVNYYNMNFPKLEDDGPGKCNRLTVFRHGWKSFLMFSKIFFHLCSSNSFLFFLS